MRKRSGGQPRLGKDDREKEFLIFITFQREIHPDQAKPRTYAQIADELNAKSLFPRKALKWNAVLVYHAYQRALEWRRRGTL